MSLRHLAKGDAVPPLQGGVLRLYSMKYCPYAQRTRIVLAYKNIKHEVVNVNLMHRPDWLQQKNILGKVPILEKNNMLLIESEVTCDYLDEIYPHPPLHPKDPIQKAQDRALVSLFELKVNAPLFKMIFKGEDSKETLQKIRPGLNVFEEELKRRGSSFFGGEKLGMLDIMLWPFVERFPVFEIFSGNEMKTPSEDQPLLRQWMKNMMKEPSVQDTYHTPDQHLKYYSSFFAGDPQYDQ